METTKICTCCNTEKSLHEFYFRKDSGKYRNECKECRNNQTKLNKTAKHSYYSEYAKKYRENNKIEIREKSKKHYYENRDDILKRRNLKRKTPDGRLKRRNERLTRRSLEKNGDIDNSYIKEITKNRSECYWCGVSIKGKPFHIDHYIALCRGGTHTKGNIVLTCPTCNMSKNKKDPFVYAQEKGRLL